MTQQRVRAPSLAGADGIHVLERVNGSELPRDPLQRLAVLGSAEKVNLVERQHRGRHLNAGDVGILEPLQVGARGREQVHDPRVRPSRLSVRVDDEEEQVAGRRRRPRAAHLGRVRRVPVVLRAHHSGQVEQHRLYGTPRRGAEGLDARRVRL